MKIKLIQEEDFMKLDREERKKELIKLKEQQRVINVIYPDTDILSSYIELHNRMTEVEDGIL